MHFKPIVTSEYNTISSAIVQSSKAAEITKGSGAIAIDEVPFPGAAEIAKGPEGVEIKAETEQDASRLRKLAEQIQKNLERLYDIQKKLIFKVHEASGKVMIIVAVESTGEVVREIPPSDMLSLAVKFDEINGLLFDQKG